MNRQNMAGVAICALIFIAGFLLAGSAGAYFNLTAFLVVFSGMGAAVFLSYPAGQIREAVRVARGAYGEKRATPEEIVYTLMDLAVKSRVDGVLSLEKMRKKTTIAYLKNALMFLVDNYKEKEIRDFLTSESHFYHLRRQRSERIFTTMARTAPAFGVAGSVIGLIGLLAGINDTSIILQSIPVAFVSTLYGVVLSNMVLAPMAEAIHFDTKSELLNHKLIMEGVVAIKREQNPHKLQKKLCSFLSPDEREGKYEALKSITRRYIDKRNRREAAREDEMVEPVPAAGPEMAARPAPQTAHAVNE